jgi:hypothetical protein
MIDRQHIDLTRREGPVQMAWPTQGNPGGFVLFKNPVEWRTFVEGLGIDGRIPGIVRRKFSRAQSLYLLGWVDISLVKAGELAALIALELAVMDRYGGQVAKTKRTFSMLLKHMVEVDGLSDAQIPMLTRCEGTAVGQLTGETRPTLAERRNTLAHGDPFEGPPTAGLLELVRDLINFAYRDYLADVTRLGGLR